MRAEADDALNYEMLSCSHLYKQGYKYLLVTL